LRRGTEAHFTKIEPDRIVVLSMLRSPDLVGLFKPPVVGYFVRGASWSGVHPLPGDIRSMTSSNSTKLFSFADQASGSTDSNYIFRTCMLFPYPLRIDLLYPDETSTIFYEVT